MDLIELDAEYKKKIESSGKKFTENLKTKKSLNEIELEYKKEVKKIRNWYNVEIEKIINKKEIKKKKLIKKEEKIKPFQTNTENTDIGTITKIKLKLEIFYFKKSIKIKNFIHSIYYPHIAFFYKKTKATLIENLKYIGLKIKYIIKVILRRISKLMEKIKIILEKIYNLFTKIFLFWKKEPKEKKES